MHDGMIAPTDAGNVQLRPLGPQCVVLGVGLLGDRQQLNRHVILSHGWSALEREGTLNNFRIAAGMMVGERRGYVFSDSDVYKWLEAAAWEIGRGGTDELRERATAAIELVAAAQEGDGYVNTWCRINDPAWRWSDLETGHELYCAGHLLQAGLAWVRAVGDTRLLEIGSRFADLIYTTFISDKERRTSGHPEIEMALVELYRETGVAKYLELADALITRRGGQQFHRAFPPEYYQDAEPVRESHTVQGHAVRAAYLGCGVADLYIETGDRALLSAIDALWHDMVGRKMYLTGGTGSRHVGEAFGDPYELPSGRAYCETCAAIGNIMWSWRMLLATGRCEFADLIERVLYNGFLAGVSLDGVGFFYVNPLQAAQRHALRQDWYPVACCPPNIMRMLASLDQYIATGDESGIQLHQYTAATITQTTSTGAVRALRIDTLYPWCGRIEVTALTAGEFAVSLRIPSWCVAATVDGKPASGGAYVTCRREWAAGESIVLQLDVAPRMTVANPRVDATRGCVAIERGPLVYCVEQTDVGDNVELADLRVDATTPPHDGDDPDGLPGMRGVSVSATLSQSADWEGVGGYRDVRLTSTVADAVGGESSELTFTAVPYFAWANRGPGAMRVWLPWQVGKSEPVVDGH